MPNIASLRVLRLAIGLSCLYLLPSPGKSAVYRAEWTELPTLVAEREVTIYLGGGLTVSGEVVEVRDSALTLDVHKGSHKGLMSIPRAEVTRLRATKMRSAWGRRLGIFFGQVAGLTAGSEFVAHVAKSEGAAVPSFVGILVGSTAAGYYVGRARDRHTVDIEVLPERPGEKRLSDQTPAVSNAKRLVLRDALAGH